MSGRDHIEPPLPASDFERLRDGVASIRPEALVKRAVINARPRICGESPRWVAVMDAFALGSTFATQLCRAHGLDPDEIVSGPRCVACNP